MSYSWPRDQLTLPSIRCQVVGQADQLVNLRCVAVYVARPGHAPAGRSRTASYLAMTAGYLETLGELGLPDAGHTPWLEAGARFTGPLRSFVRRL